MPCANGRSARASPPYARSMAQAFSARRSPAGPAPAGPAARLRRAFSVWQFAAAAVLPLWLLLGYAIWGSSAAGVLAVVLVVPIVAAAELGLALLFSARRRTRTSRALDLPTVAVLGVFQLAVVGFGFFGPATAWFGLVAAVAAIGGFWLGTRLVVQDVRRRVDALRAPVTDRRPIDAGEYVVVKPAQR